MATTIVPAPASQPVLESPLPPEVLSHLYSSMLRARLLTRRIRNARQSAEAVLSALLQNLEDSDQIVTDAAHPVLEVLRGADLNTFVGPKLATRGNGSSSIEIADSRIVAADSNTAPAIATGMAIALKKSQAAGIVVALLAGKTAKGSVWEQTVRFAGEHRLPIIFIADWTDTRTFRRHDGRDLSHWPCPTIAVDGRDVIAAYRVTKEAVASARRGYGPTLVDCINFLAPGPRGRDERDPITSFRGYLKRHSAWSDEWAANLEAQFKRELGLDKKRR